MPSRLPFENVPLFVIGNINRDIKTAPLPAGDYLFGDGETSVASIVESIGGGGANSAFAAAALGAEVTFLGKIGRDGLGKRIDRTLKKHGLKAHLAEDANEATGSSIALSFENGQRHFVSCLPASAGLKFEDLQLDALKAGAHLLRADIWFSESMLLSGNRRLFETARERGMAVSMDVNWDPRWGKGSPEEIQARKKAVRESLPLVNLVHGNIRELMEFSDAPDLRTALARLEEWGAEAVVVHMGGQGAGFYRDGSLAIEPPAALKACISSTGSGDVLSVCMMLQHHLSDVPVETRLRGANAVVANFMAGELKLIPNLEE